MTILSKLMSKLGGRQKLDAKTLRTAELVYRMKYRDHYAPIFAKALGGDKELTNKRIAELYMFRAWALRFGYEVFSTDKVASEQAIDIAVSDCGNVGAVLFFPIGNGFQLDEALGGSFFDCVDSRWQAYDMAFVQNRSKGIPLLEITSELCDFCDIHDPVVTHALSVDLFAILTEVKANAIRIGLLKSR